MSDARPSCLIHLSLWISTHQSFLCTENPGFTGEKRCQTAYRAVWILHKCAQGCTDNRITVSLSPMDTCPFFLDIFLLFWMIGHEGLGITIHTHVKKSYQKAAPPNFICFFILSKILTFCSVSVCTFVVTPQTGATMQHMRHWNYLPKYEALQKGELGRLSC